VRYHLQTARAAPRECRAPLRRAPARILILRAVSLPRGSRGSARVRSSSSRACPPVRSPPERKRPYRRFGKGSLSGRVGAAIRLLEGYGPKPMSLPRATAPAGARRMCVGFLEVREPMGLREREPRGRAPPGARGLLRFSRREASGAAALSTRTRAISRARGASHARTSGPSRRSVLSTRSSSPRRAADRR
jgi:hypothetical protein